LRSCSALIGSAPSICARRRRERLAETLAPVGPQGPPALRAARLVAVAALRAGPSCGLPGRAAPVPTCPPCPRTPVHYLSGRYTPPAWDARQKKSRTRAPGLSSAHRTIWGAQGSRVRLTDGLARTKETPTSVPTVPYSIPDSHPFHALRVGNPGGGLTCRNTDISIWSGQEITEEESDPLIKELERDPKALGRLTAHAVLWIRGGP
jgi:hypothetical protein